MLQVDGALELRVHETIRHSIVARIGYEKKGAQQTFEPFCPSTYIPLTIESKQKAGRKQERSSS
jgi:hypothetical protein